MKDKILFIFKKKPFSTWQIITIWTSLVLSRYDVDLNFSSPISSFFFFFTFLLFG